MRFPQRPLSQLQFGFPGFPGMIGGRPIEPAHDLVRHTTRRLGCYEAAAREAALQLRAIKAVQEAEDTGELHHVLRLGELSAEGRLRDEALPADFHKRLHALHMKLTKGARGRGRPKRPVADTRKIKEFHDFAVEERPGLDAAGRPKRKSGYSNAIQWLAEDWNLSPEAVKKVLSTDLPSPREDAVPEGEARPRSIFDPDHERFFAWARMLART